ncbi:MAG: SCO family protein [Acidobacteria bacterium]|nr:SCO family protein [Acidobacteriota bacterium]
MTNRRKVLTQLAAGAAAIPAIALGTSAQGPHGDAHETSAPDNDCRCVRPDAGPYADYFPNVVVNTHDGRKALFYQDLLRGRAVLINCMSIKNEKLYPVTANLVKVQRLLGERLGRDVFMYSLSVDPENDTPRALRAFAEKHGVGAGWLFLSAKPEDVQAVRGRLFAHEGAHQQHGSAPAKDCSMGLIRYGNESVGLWGSVPAKAEPEWIVRRLSWVETRSAAAASASAAFRRKGPLPAVVSAKPLSRDSGRRS